MKPLLIVRPEPGASATAARAIALGLSPVVCSLFEIVPREWEAPDAAPFDAIVLTSANAVRHAGSELARYLHLPAFVVGNATAAAAREAGFETIMTSNLNAAGVFRTIEKHGKRHPLHIAGQHRTAHAALPFVVTTRIVYEAVTLSVTLPEPPYAVMIHSVRACQRFERLCTAPENVDVVAISTDVAGILGRGWRSISIADLPHDDAMLELAARLCKEDVMPMTGPA